MLPSQLKSLHVHQSHDFSILPLDFHTTSNEKHFFKQTLDGWLVCQYKQHQVFQCGNCLTDVRIFFLVLDESLGYTIPVFAWYLQISVLLFHSTKPLRLCEWNKNMIFETFKNLFCPVIISCCYWAYGNDVNLYNLPIENGSAKFGLDLHAILLRKTK